MGRLASAMPQRWGRGALCLLAPICLALPDARAAGAEGDALQHPLWAYAVPWPPSAAATPTPVWDNKTLLSLPGSRRRYAMAQIHPGLTDAGVADWYPQDHPPMPPLVSDGDPARKIRPCGLCHLPDGSGRPENAPIAGLPRAYIVEQLQDMKAGRRISAEPRKTNVGAMNGYAKAMSDSELEAVARYFSAIRPRASVRVVETERAPLVASSGGLYLPLTGDKAGDEPIGARLIETPADPRRTEAFRDPHSPFLAYVPKGAVGRGKAVVDTGAQGLAPPCAACHGPGLTGAGSVPGIAGRSPSYLARQLNDFRTGARHGVQAAPMMTVAATLSDSDILNATAYLASLPPALGAHRP